MHTIELVPINEVHANADNPREIEDGAFDKLKQSIKDFPKMGEIRPLVVDEQGVVHGGNQRLRAYRELGYTKVHIIRASDFTEAELKEFLVKDNISAGYWDFEKLMADFDETDLDNWGIDAIGLLASDDVNKVNKGDEYSEWVGMPEFTPKLAGPKIVIQFSTLEEREQFAAQQGMQFTQKTQGAWSAVYPYKSKDMGAKIYVDDSQ